MLGVKSIHVSKRGHLKPPHLHRHRVEFPPFFQQVICCSQSRWNNCFADTAGNPSGLTGHKNYNTSAHTSIGKRHVTTDSCQVKLFKLYQTMTNMHQKENMYTLIFIISYLRLCFSGVYIYIIVSIFFPWGRGVRRLLCVRCVVNVLLHMSLTCSVVYNGALYRAAKYRIYNTGTVLYECIQHAWEVEFKELSYWARVTHTCVTNLGHHWFR